MKKQILVSLIMISAFSFAAQAVAQVSVIAQDQDQSKKDERLTSRKNRPKSEKQR